MSPLETQCRIDEDATLVFVRYDGESDIDSTMNQHHMLMARGSLITGTLLADLLP